MSNPSQRTPRSSSSGQLRSRAAPQGEAGTEQTLTLPRCEVIAGTDPQTAISTETLFGSRREILLSHEGTLYRLRITSKDKLILTK